jgi:hypothetical protein
MSEADIRRLPMRVFLTGAWRLGSQSRGRHPRRCGTAATAVHTAASSVDRSPLRRARAGRRCRRRAQLDRHMTTWPAPRPRATEAIDGRRCVAVPLLFRVSASACWPSRGESLSQIGISCSMRRRDGQRGQQERAHKRRGDPSRGAQARRAPVLNRAGFAWLRSRARTGTATSMP